MIEVLSFQKEHQREVLELILEIQRDEFGFSIRAEDQPDLSDIENFYQSGAGGFWVAVAESRVVGTIALRDIGNGQGALRKMFVKASHRGKEFSVAPKLLEHLVLSAQCKGVRELFLGTTERFLAAHRFYEKQGFVRVAPELLPLAFPRMAVDTRFYHRVIT